MAQSIRIKMMDKENNVALSGNFITESSIRHAFLLPPDAIVKLFFEANGMQITCGSRTVRDGFFEPEPCFLLPELWPTLVFFVDSTMPPMTPATPIDVRRIVSPYPEAPPPPPMSKSIDRWMFFSSDSTGKSTVVCVHPRYFVTHRHGSHLLLQVGSTLKIFHAKPEDESNAENGFDVSVVDINEVLDFVLLRSNETLVQTAPQLVGGEESEVFLLAGFGDVSSGCQKLAYLSGIIHSARGYYFSIDENPSAPLMGPFYLGTGQTSRGDSGGACWSARGLVGINYGVTCMPDYGFTHIAIAEAATYSPKNIISPAVRIQDSLMAQLRIEQRNSPTSPPAKRKLVQTVIEGLGPQTMFVNEEGI